LRLVVVERPLGYSFDDLGLALMAVRIRPHFDSSIGWESAR